MKNACKRLITAVLVLAFMTLPRGNAESEPPARTFHIGFSSDMFTDVNENDARAAVKIWGELIAKTQGIPADPDPALYEDFDSLHSAVRKKNVDAVGITTTDYFRIRRETRFSPIFVSYSTERFTEQYVLLAHKDGAVKSLGDLRGRSLFLHSNPRLCLALMWLDTLLLKQGYPQTTRFVGSLLSDAKIAKTVLPVFFRKTDACIVTRNGFDTMRELNPQLTRQLTVLAESPEIVPTVLAFRADYNPPFKDRLLTGISSLKTTAAGKQVLTLFFSKDIAEQPESCLDSALEIVETHEHLIQGKQP